MANNYKVSGKKMTSFLSVAHERHARKTGVLPPKEAEQPLWSLLGLKGSNKKFCKSLGRRRNKKIEQLKGKRGEQLATISFETFGCPFDELYY